MSSSRLSATYCVNLDLTELLDFGKLQNKEALVLRQLLTEPFKSRALPSMTVHRLAFVYRSEQVCMSNMATLLLVNSKSAAKCW